MDISKTRSFHDVRWKVVENYEIDSPEFLNLETGEILIVSSQSEDGEMWFGQKGLETGWFPRYCVTEYTSGNTYTVNYNFNGDLDNDELVVTEGDVVELISLCKNGWIWVKCGDREGFIPASYTSVSETDTETINQEYQRKYKTIKDFFARRSSDKDNISVTSNTEPSDRKTQPNIGMKLDSKPTLPPRRPQVLSTEEYYNKNVDQSAAMYMNKEIPDFTSIRNPSGCYDNDVPRVDHVADMYMNKEIPDFISQRSKGVPNSAGNHEKADQNIEKPADTYMNQTIPDFLSKDSEEIPPVVPVRSAQKNILGDVVENANELAKRKYTNEATNIIQYDDEDAYTYINESQLQDLTNVGDQVQSLKKEERVDKIEPPPRPPRRPQKGALRWIKAKVTSAIKGDNTDVMQGFRDNDELRIVLVGRTGSGKSATGNSIIAATKFESRMASNSITKECMRAENRLNGRKIVVVDTPGLFDTSLDDNQIKEEIIKCIQMSLPGPHAFLLVLQVARFTKEEIETFQRIFNYFGDSLCKFAIVTFTRLDDLSREDQTLETFIRNSTTALQDLLARCQHRSIAFDNNESSRTKSKKVEKLVTMIDGIVKANKGAHYTNDMYKLAEDNLRRKIKNAEKQKALEKQQEIAKIESKFVDAIADMKTENSQLLKMVEKNKHIEEDVRKERIQAQSEIKRLQNEIRAIDKKRDVELFNAKQREKIEKEKVAKELEAQEYKTQQLLQGMEQKIAEAENKLKSMEIEKEKEIKKSKENLAAEVNIQIKQIMEENNRRVDSMIDTIKMKEMANENLRREINVLMSEKDVKFAEMSQQLKRVTDEAEANFQKQLAYQKEFFEKQRAATETNFQKELQKRDAKQSEEIEKLKRNQMELQKQNDAEVERTKQAMEYEKQQAAKKHEQEMKQQQAMFQQKQSELENFTRVEMDKHKKNFTELQQTCEDLKNKLDDKCTVS